jgi:transcription initiation factor TFIIIB Brf1 subunit/transcription initiation factor TFIIB
MNHIMSVDHPPINTQLFIKPAHLEESLTPFKCVKFKDNNYTKAVKKVQIRSEDLILNISTDIDKKHISNKTKKYVKALYPIKTQSKIPMKPKNIKVTNKHFNDSNSKCDDISQNSSELNSTYNLSVENMWNTLFEEVNSNNPPTVSEISDIEPVVMKSMTVHTNMKTGSMTKYITNGDVVNMSLEENVKFNISDKNTICKCGKKLFVSSNILICLSCGVELPNSSNITEEEYSTSALTDCNVNSNGFIAMKMIGKGSYGYQRSMLKTCANYKKYRRLNTLKDMKNWNIHSKKHHIPKNVIKEANDMFAKIKEHGYVFRKDGKKGVLSACLYYACYNNNISKTPSEIAQFSSIEEKFHSLGDRILHDLNERGVIEIPVKINPIADYVDRYMTLLSIPNKYRVFILELISRADKKHIHILHDSKNNTKCVGAIYMLIDRVPELRARITKEQIEVECGISKTTFIRYCNVLCFHYKKLKKIFKRHHISMKAEWRDIDKKQ